MAPDDRTALLEDLPGNVVAQLLQLLSPEEKKVAQSLLGYPEDSVGRLMTPDFIKVGPKWTIKQVLDHIRANGRDSETLNVIYVTDDQGRLIDDVRIREFLLRPLDTIVEHIHDSSYLALHATDPASDALEAFKKYDRNTVTRGRPGTETPGDRNDRRHARCAGGGGDRGHPQTRRHRSIG
jgi:magnesium transporter